MKLTKNIGLWVAALATLLTACDDSEYDLQTLVPDRYHAVVNVQDDSDRTLRIYDTGLAKTYEFTVLRGGSDPSIAIEAEVVPMTQKELSEIDTDYVLLPASHYTLDGAISIPAHTGSAKFSASFTPAQISRIRELNASLDPGKIYCLAVKITSDRTTVYEDKNYVVRRLDVMLPELGFAEAGTVAKKLYDAKQTVTFDFRVVRGQTDETQPVAASLVPMTDTELAAIDPAYMAIPAEMYTLDRPEIEVPAGEEQLPLSVSFTGDQITALRELTEARNRTAVLGLKLVSQSSGTVADKGTLLYVLDITQPILHFELVSGAAPNQYRQWWWDNRHDNGSWNLTWSDYKTPVADCWGGGVTFRLKMPAGIQNTWTIKCRFDYDASLIAAYNEIEEKMNDGYYGGLENWRKIRTDYDALPSASDMAFFDASGNRIEEITMEPGMNEVLVTYKRNTGSFNGAGLYLCPIAASTDIFPVDTEQYVLFRDEITLPDKTLWEPFAPGEGTLSALYDGNRWGNSWQTSWFPGYFDKQFGQYFQINIPSYQPSHAIRFTLWCNADNEWHWNEATAPREMKVFITTDAVPAPTGDYTPDRTVYDALTWVEVAHLWCDAHSGRSYTSPSIDLGGRKANAIRICTYSKAGDSASYKRQDNLGDFNTAPYNSEVQSVCRDQTFWNGWEDTYGNNIVITEFKMWGN